MTQQNKNRWIASGVTTVSVAILLLLMLMLGMTYQIPPQDPLIYIELSLEAGGGGGGGATQLVKQQPSESGENIATQIAEDAPSVNVNRNKKEKTTEDQTPKVNESSLYKGGRGGSGSGGGAGSGEGAGTGSGYNLGEGDGTGGNIGYGTGARGYTYMPNLEIENETGVVYVEVHVTEDGNVIEARIISNRQYPTSITNANIQAMCVARAKTAKFKKGKEEFRIIIFKK